MTVFPHTRPARWWLALHLPLAMLVFQLALNWIDPAQTDPWLELPVLALVGLAVGQVLPRGLPWLRARLSPLGVRSFYAWVLTGSTALLWLALTAGWVMIYLIEFLLGFGIADTARMLLLMPLILAFYLPLLVLLGSACGLVTARFLLHSNPGENKHESAPAG